MGADKKDSSYDDLPYRPCIGIVLFNNESKVFVGERIDTPGNWQMPQGGIDEGENIDEAFFRELKEEIGTDNALILKVMDEKTRYDLPAHLIPRLWAGQYRGQEQTWVAARFLGDDKDINISNDDRPEFSAWQWVELGKVTSLIVPFKLDTYEKVIKTFSQLDIN